MHQSLRVDRLRILFAIGLAFALLLGGVPLSGAQQADAQVEPDEIVVENGVTQPVFSYENAIRERVLIPGVTSSADGDATDMLNVDIIRPAASDNGLKVPTIIVASPYYLNEGRGRLSQIKPPAELNTITVGDAQFTGNLLTPASPLTGQSGRLVFCGFAATAADCPADTAGAIAVIERGNGISFNQKAASAQAAGAIGAIIYNNVSGSFSTTVTGVTIPVVGTTTDVGMALRDRLGQVAELDAITQDHIDFFPLYYDNYFVPRGYAVALLDLAGTRASSGCLDIGGPGEIDNTGQFIKWLTGDAPGFDVDGNPVTADWSNGKSGMVGKSWDGTVANGVAALGLEGLTTIVPIAGISSWYLWYWHNGARFTGHSPLSLAQSVGDAPASQCTETQAALVAGNTEDPTTDFWMDRNYIKDVANFKASVFIVHGKQDWNVKPSNYGELWDALEEHDIPRKIWLAEVAHEKAFDFRRAEWINTIHRWYDYWLQGVENGIMDEPIADVEHGTNNWDTYDTWPGGTAVDLALGQPDDADDDRPGTLSLSASNQDPGTQSFTELRRSYNSAANAPFADDPSRVVFLSEELNREVRVSGTTNIKLRASFDDDDSHLTAYLVDYGTDTRTDWATGAGLINLDTTTCIGQGTEVDTGCFPDVGYRTATRPFEVVSRGTANIPFVAGVEQLVPGQAYDVEWDIMATDYVFKPGHRIGIVISGVDSTTIANHGTNGVEVTVDLANSSVELPIVGGAVTAGFAFAEGELDRLVADGGITAGLEAKIRHALAQAELWLSLDQQRPIAGTHLERAIHLLLWQADVIDQKGKTNQGDAAALRRLAASLQALLDELPDQN